MSFNLNTEKSTSVPELAINEGRRDQESNIPKNTQEDKPKKQKSMSIEEVVEEQSISTVHSLEDYIHHSEEIIVLDNFLLSSDTLFTAKEPPRSASYSKSALKQEKEWNLSFSAEEGKRFSHSDYKDVSERAPDFSISSQTASEEARSEPGHDIKLDGTYKKLKRQHNKQKRKGNFLRKKLPEYYTKKMYHVLTKDTREESQQNYEKVLDELDDAFTVDKQNIVHEEIALSNKWPLQKEQVSGPLESLQQIERTYSNHFAESDSANQNRIDRYLKHQKNELLLLAKLRLQYIKGQYMFAEGEQQMNANGPNLHLMNYQLKHDNSNIQDKLEKKQQEQSAIHFKREHLITQILAHRRQKYVELDMSIKDLNEQFDEVVSEYEDVREQLSFLKQEQDLRSSEIEKLKVNSGLLTNPMLLMNMQSAMEDVKELTQKLEDVKHALLNRLMSLGEWFLSLILTVSCNVTVNESNVAVKSAASKIGNLNKMY